MDEALEKSAFVGSLVCFVYFTGLILISYAQFDHVIIGVVVELVTLPLILLLISTLILSSYLWFKEKFSFKSRNFYSFLINTLAATMLVSVSLLE